MVEDFRDLERPLSWDFKDLFIFLREKERDRAQRGGAEGEGETES